jgi:hypothetical protein
MTSFFSDLEDQLRTAAQEQTSGVGAPSPGRPPRRGRRWLAGGARLVPVAVAVAVALAVVVGALVLLGHRGAQSPSTPASGGPDNAFATLILNTPKAQLRRELTLMSAATRTVLASAACRVSQSRSAPQVHGLPGQELLSTLGALRRPATAADRLPAGSLSAMGPGVAMYAGAARRAATIAGTTYYLVPIREDPAGGSPSIGCFALQKAAIAKALPTFPAALRTPIRELAAAAIAYATRQAGKPGVDAICEATVHRNGGGFSCGETAEEIRHGLYPEQDNGTFSGLVPDGVATVMLSFPAAGGRRARSVTAPVHGNVYVVDTGDAGPVRPGSFTVVWHAADGRMLRSYSTGTPSSLKALCRQRPEACIDAVLLEGSSSQGASASSSSSSASATATATVPSRPSGRVKASSGR